MMEPRLLIRRATREAQALLDQLYAKGDPVPGSPLDQFGLRDGLQIVEDYLAHGELGIAFEHLMYMVVEPPLILSNCSRTDIREAAELLGMTHLLARLPNPR